MIFPILRKLVSQTQQARTKTILVMKWTAIFLLAGCLQVAASGNAQHIQLKFSNASLKTVFKDISKQTGYSFFYNAKLLQGMEKVDVDLKNATLKEALEAALKDLPLTFSIVNTTIVVKPKPGADVAAVAEDVDVVITGKVLDETGKPLEGASISVKGSDKGTSSAADGSFSITVEKGAEILITYLGYEPFRFSARKDGAQVVRMRLSQLKDSMQNVVVTGFQNIRRDNFTGTAVTVSGEDLKAVNPQNLLRAFQAYDPAFRVAENNLLGSDPNRLPNITVRGSTALPSGSNSDVISRENLSNSMNLPVFILDGYEVSLQKIYDLDINRVQSVTLLKDAAATAVYGSRAANGVMVIYTKVPKAGKLQVSYNSELQLTTPDLTEYNVLDGAQKLAYENAAGLYDANKNGALSQDQLEQLYYHKLGLVVSGVNTYWLSQPLRTAYGQKHSLFVEGGGAAFRYGLEFRYQTMPGVMKGSTRDRLNTGLHFTYSPGNNLLFRNVLTVTQMNATESPWGNFSDYVRMNPYYPKTDSSGRVLQVVDAWTDRRNGGVGTYPIMNPMYNATLGSFDKSNYLEIIDALTAEWTIVPGLKLRGLMTLNKTKSTGDRFLSPFANQFYNYPSTRVNEKGSYDYNTNDETSFETSLNMSYNKMLGKHFINTMVGMNMQTYLSEYRAISAVGFTNDRFSDIGFANSYALNSAPYSNVNETRRMGLMFSTNYSYDNRFLMDVVFTQDGSSRFGSNKRFAPFGSLGLGWNLHKESFMSASPFSRLRVKASTGFTGSVSFSPYMSQTTYSYYNGNWYSTGIGAVVNNFGNADLEWQRTTNYDVGMEIGLFNDQVLIMPRYYRKLTRGLLADISLPPSTGFGSYKDNVGDMENIGQELNIQANVYRNKNWNVNVFANFTRNTNTIVRISNSLKAYNDKVEEEQANNPDFKGVPLLRYEEGRSLYALYAVRSLGIDPESGRELFMKRDGTLTYDWSARDMVVAGDTEPTAWGFFGTSARYKQFNVNLSFYTTFGGDKYNQTLVDRVENADPRYNVDARVFEEKWKQSGDRTFYKNIADLGYTDVTSRFIQKDNVLELQSVNLSYDVADVRRWKIGMQSLRFAVTMNDIWRISSIKQERGIDYPYARSVTFSLQASF